MVVTEALAHGVPVLATAVGGVPEALGHAPDGSVPGMLVTAGGPGGARGGAAPLARRARVRRRLTGGRPRPAHRAGGWETTARSLAGALERLRREPRRAA